MKRNFRYMDKPLFFATIIFFAFGLIMILSASNIESFVRYDNSPYQFFMKQLISIAVGIGAFIYILAIPIKKHAVYIKMLLLGLIGILILLITTGSATNESVSWFNFGIFGIQPSEFGKIIIILYMAIYYEKNQSKLDNFSVIFKPIWYVFIITALIFLQNDYGTAIMFALLSFFIFYLVPMSKKIRSQFNKVVMLLIILIILVVTVSGNDLLPERQKKRIDFANPCQKYQTGEGYQVCNGYIAINNGGLAGVGLGKSTQKYLYLPEAHTDFIYAIIVEEIGVIAGVIILIAYGFVLIRIVKVGKKSSKISGKMICYGVAAYIFIQVIVNLVGVLGLGPMTGVILPFLSYGGSFAITLICSLGFVQRVAIENHLEQKKKLT